jgi:acetoin utilization deacetylase AcuC-like enzyme
VDPIKPIFTVYSPLHALHNPPYEYFDGGTRVAYLESPERAWRILTALQSDARFVITAPQDFGLDPVLTVHDAGYIEFLQTAWARWQEIPTDYPKEALLPTTFAIRRSAVHQREDVLGAAGYYLMDLSAPIAAGTWQAALASAHCALSAAQHLRQEGGLAFALCRPPGHHAGFDYAGGYCYLNNAAIAAQSLTALGSVALLDIDYHAGNGTQDIFYNRDDVFTQSIHADPNGEYPHFWGYASETGAGAGLGFHQNYPLPPGTGEALYLDTLDQALERIRTYQPGALVISLGVDTLSGDELGTFYLSRDTLAQAAARIASLQLPTLTVMEGGYNNADLGGSVLAFLEGLL